MMKFLLGFLSASLVLQLTLSLPIEHLALKPLQEKLEDGTPRIWPKARPEYIQISFKSPKSDEVPSDFQANSSSKQIPVISDIERIKKIIEIVEYVGEKVEQVLENVQPPQSLTSESDNQRTVKQPTNDNPENNNQDIDETTLTAM